MRKLELAEAPRGSSEKRDEEVVAVLVEQRVPSRVLGKSIIRTALPLAILAAAAPALAQADQLSTNTFGGASASLTAGIQLLREGKWQEAAAEAEKAEAAAVTPQQKAEALLLRAHALTLGGNVAEAARVYQRAALLDGVSPSQRLEAWQGAERAAAAAGLTGLQRQAVEALLSAPQLSPSERARLLTQLGEAFLRDGDEERAAQAFVEVTTRYPDEYAAALCRRHLVSILARRQQIEPLLQTLAEARRQNRPEAEQLHLQAAQILQ
ncbi:MAG: hypothetical protein H5T86_00875, partial [Armatimonadetes bacterium]|nr:hypothetical protein [Armatimonadota bacterium]